uniref:Centrosomal protein of 162 kDa n=1 Tax=Macrostomum lignano TaxID=282301 RepID=A0A1I8FNR5_9PLAT
ERSLSTEKSRYAEEAVELAGPACPRSVPLAEIEEEAKESRTSRATSATICRSRTGPACRASSDDRSAQLRRAQPMRRAPRETRLAQEERQHREGAATRRGSRAELREQPSSSRGGAGGGRQLLNERRAASGPVFGANSTAPDGAPLLNEYFHNRTLFPDLSWPRSGNRAESRAREFQELTEAAKRDSLRLSERQQRQQQPAQRLKWRAGGDAQAAGCAPVKQDVAARQREAEADQLRQDKYQLREELNSARKDADKFRFDCESRDHALNANREVSARLEERLTSAECRCSSLEEQLKSLQTEARSLQRERGELQALRRAKRNATLAKEKEALLRQLGSEASGQGGTAGRNSATSGARAGDRQAGGTGRSESGFRAPAADAADRVSRLPKRLARAEEERRLLEGLRKAQAAELERLQRSLSDRDAELAAAHGRTTAARQEAAELSAQALRLGQERSELRERLAESERRLAGLAAAGRSALEHLLRMGGAGRPRLCLDEADGGEAAADAERVGSDLALASLWALDTWQRTGRRRRPGQVREAGGENRQLLRKSLSQLANVETELADLRCLLEKQRLPEQPADIDRRYRKLKDTVQGLREDLSLAERLAAKPQAAQH